MKFGFSVNIDKKSKDTEQIKNITKETTTINKEIKEIVKQELIEMRKQTGSSKDIHSVEKEVMERTERKLSINKENKNNEIQVVQHTTDNNDIVDSSGNKKRKKIQFINNSKDTTVDHKTLFFFEKCNYDCKVKFKCMFSVACIKNAIVKTKDTIVNSISCVANSVASATCKVTNAITTATCNATKCVSNTIASGLSNLKHNIVSGYQHTKTSIKSTYIYTKQSIYQSVIITKIRNFKHTRFWIVTKKYTKLFFIYVFCIWICRRKEVIDQSSEEYKEEYIKNNATYSTEFDHLPILGEDAIV